ncbi:hypothetical protein HDU86_000848 [Geranomyces michiganensis]|nr:hypothetical protein HDU86_000848 [Geranomyces michiganensis]
MSAHAKIPASRADAELNNASIEASAAKDLAVDAAAHTANAAKIGAHNAKVEVEQKWEEVKPGLKATFNQGKDADMVAAEEERRKLESS